MVGADNEPTPERVAKAKICGNKIVARVHHDANGFPTASYHWEITPTIDKLLQRGTITGTEWSVALRYMRHYAGSRHKGPESSRILPKCDASFSGMEPAERATAYGQAIARARQATPTFFWPVLRWLELAAEDEQPLFALGAWYFPQAAQATQAAKGGAYLNAALAFLAAHYEMPSRFKIVENGTLIKISAEIEELRNGVMRRINQVMTIGESIQS